VRGQIERERRRRLALCAGVALAAGVLLCALLRLLGA
jgi:hypothetical protein